MVLTVPFIFIPTSAAFRMHLSASFQYWDSVVPEFA